MGRGQHPKDPERMCALALAAAASSDDEGSSLRAKRKSSRKRKLIVGSGNSFGPPEVEMASDADDNDFAAEVSSTESSETESNIQELTNAEVRFDSSGWG